MAKQLTDKQRKFVKAKATGVSGTKAAMIAYDVNNERTASVIATENLAKPSIQEAVQKEMARQGIDLESIVRPITDGLKAEKVSIVGNGEQAMAEVTPDHGIRLKASKMAQDLIGVNNRDGTTVNVNFVKVVKEDKDEYGL